jgi:hypothetical protein
MFRANRSTSDALALLLLLRPGRLPPGEEDIRLEAVPGIVVEVAAEDIYTLMGSALDNVSASHRRRRSGVSQWRSGDSELEAFRAYRMELQIRFSHEVLMPANLFDRLTRALLSFSDHALLRCAKPLLPQA